MLCRAHPADTACSSAKDQLSGTSVAIKKIMKPFSTPVLSKRTYRELKLLKHLRHENVSERPAQTRNGHLQRLSLTPSDHLVERHLHLASRGHVSLACQKHGVVATAAVRFGACTAAYLYLQP